MTDIPSPTPVYTWVLLVAVQLTIALAGFSSSVIAMILGFQQESAMGILFFLAALIEGQVAQMMLQEAINNYWRHVDW